MWDFQDNSQSLYSPWNLVQSTCFNSVLLILTWSGRTFNVLLKSIYFFSMLSDSLLACIQDCTSFSSRFIMSIRLRSCLFCEGRISVLKRWFKTPIQNAVHGSTVYASLEKKTISWACTAHCSRLLFELKWTGKAFIWRHLNVVICDFVFMLPPESAFCSITTIVNANFWAFWISVLKRRLF